MSVKKGGCGQCPYTEETCYELRRTGGICAYDGVFTQIEFDKCQYRLAPTNADRIRAMSDEELAEYLTNICDPYYLQCGGWLAWLKEEVEE